MAADKNTYSFLSDHTRIPNIGLGTWKSAKGDVKNAVIAAIDAGYRHLDCAFIYQNEEEIGEALKEKIKDGTIERDDIYITTKLWGTHHSPSRVEQGIKMSLTPLQLDYVDLYLMHSPCGRKFIDDKTFFPKDENDKNAYDDVHYVETWKAMEKLVEKGLAISIGVSNFNVPQMEEIVTAAQVPCVMNQIEIHPAIDQSDIITYCKAKSIALTAYSPFGSPDRPWASDKDPNLFEDPVVKEIAESRGCTAGQVLLAYHLNQEIVVVPKSVTPSRIKENFE
ncbi:aldo-keto reductase, partial [Apostichopus japonicus]